MRSLRVILMSFMCVIILFTVAGCKNKSPIKVDNFETKMEESGYLVQDVTTKSSDDYVEKAYLAVDKDGKYQIEFYVFSNKENAKQFYNSNKSIFEESKTVKAIEHYTSAGNHDKYTLEVDKKYKVVSRIADTVIYIDADATYKSDIKDALKNIGY